jgi:putative phage-type endonuclease
MKLPIASLPVRENTPAKFLGSHENGSPDWHAVRAQGIGGSEVGTIAGLNKWESAYTLWAKKSGLISSDIPQSEAMEAGSRLESFILNWFAEVNPSLLIDGNVGTFAGSLGWDHANPDAVYVDENAEFGLIEVKTARFEDEWIVPPKGVDGDASGIPRNYLSQVQWYLRIMGYQNAYLVVLFGGQKLRQYRIAADPYLQQVDLTLATEFWACLENGQKPDWDGSTSTYETVRAMHPDIIDEVVDLPDDLGRSYLQALVDSKQAELVMQGFKNQVLDFMGMAKAARIDGVVRCTRQAGRNGAAPFLVNKESK